MVVVSFFLYSFGGSFLLTDGFFVKKKKEDKGAGSEILGSPQQQEPSPHSISPSTSTTTSESVASDPNAVCTPNPISDSAVHYNAYVNPNLDATPSLNANIHDDANSKPEEDDLLEYNVFVLDASIDDLRREVPHLMMKICGPGVPGGAGVSASGMEDDKIKSTAKARRGSELIKANTEPTISISTSTSYMQQRNVLFDVGAHTDGPDGHLVEEGIFEKEERERQRQKRGGNGMDMDVVGDMDVDMDMDMDDGSVDIGAKKQEQEAEGDVLLPNTVDFALREKEEMRDLTKASEIISLYPEPCSPPPSSTKPGFTHTSIPLSSSPSSPSSPPKRETPETKPTWDPLVGQVYLGNSGDVPLAPDVPSHFRHAASLVRDAALLGNPCAGLEEYFSTEDDDDDDEVKEEKEGGSSSSSSSSLPADDIFNYHATNDPINGFGYDIAVECHELAPFPSTAHLRAADEHLGMLDLLWKERWERGWRAREEEKRVLKKKIRKDEEDDTGRNTPTIPLTPPPTPPRPPPHASAVIHLPFPSSPSNSQTTMVSLIPVIRFLEKWMKPLPPVPPMSGTTTEMKNLKLVGSGDVAGMVQPQTQQSPPPPSSPPTTTTTVSARRWSSVAALMPSFPSFPLGGSSSSTSTSNSTPSALTNNAQPNLEPTSTATVATTLPPTCPLPPHPSRTRSFTSPPPSTSSITSGAVYQPPPPPIPKPPQQQQQPQQQQTRTRPLKILLYSSDGYTESSVPALCLLMAIKSLNLPEAYLELQVVKRRSFFVYHADLGILRRVEMRLKEEKERERERERLNGGSGLGVGSVNGNGKRTVPVRGGYWSGTVPGGSGSPYPGGAVPPTTSGRTTRVPPPAQKSSFMGRPAAKSISFAQVPHHSMVVSSQQSQQQHENYQQQQQQQQQPPTAPHPIPVSASYLGQATFSGGSLPAQTQQMMLHHHHHHHHHHQPGVSSSGFQQEAYQMIKGRPRANTSPWLPSLFGGDHQSWFNDPRFDGSFPSRVLPFLYLGNLCVLFFFFFFERILIFFRIGITRLMCICFMH